MELIAEIPVKKTNHSRIHEVNFNDLEFGKHVSDHMLVCDFIKGEWQIPHILPFANLSVSPSALALHYGQTGKDVHGRSSQRYFHRRLIAIDTPR